MNIRFENRQLSGSMVVPGLRFEVEKMSWALQGGPAKAGVKVSGAAGALGQVMQLLRCGVVISDEQGDSAWWGYVDAVEIELAGFKIRASLGDLANRVAVRYRDERIGPEVVQGWQFQTGWVEDLYSQAEWGKKEQIFTKVPASPGEALALAAAELDARKRPRLKPAAAGRGIGIPGGGVARLELKGWWDTLGWVYWSEARGYVGAVSGSTLQAVGNLAANTAAAGSFSSPLAWDVYTLWLKAARFGAPADTLQVGIYADGGGTPGALLGSGSLASSSFDGEGTWKRVDLLTPVSIAAGTTYWVAAQRTGALDVNNYYRVTVDEGLGYAGGALLLWNGAAWVARAPAADLAFQVTGNQVTTTQIATMGAPAGAGQFLKGVQIQDASGVYGRLYRDGRETALKEVIMLLEQGDSSGGRLMGQITRERMLVVSKVSAAPSKAAADLVLLGSGELRSQSGGKLLGGSVGKWARLDGMTQWGGDRSALGVVLVEAAEWRRDGRLGQQEKVIIGAFP